MRKQLCEFELRCSSSGQIERTQRFYLPNAKSRCKFESNSTPRGFWHSQKNIERFEWHLSQKGMLTENRSSEILSKVHVAKPCPANWREMKGTDQVRHCTHCAKNVYNLSNMSRQEAADLIERSEGKVCVRYYMRPDGGVMTKDCPKPMRRKTRMVAVLTSLLSIVGLTGVASAMQTAVLGRPARPQGRTMGELAYRPLQGKPVVHPPTKDPNGTKTKPSVKTLEKPVQKVKSRAPSNTKGN